MVNQPEIKKILNRLGESPVRNCSMIGFMKDYPVSMILSEGDSILIKGKSDREWVYISSEKEQELRILLSKIKPTDLFFASIEDRMIPIISESRSIDWKLQAFRYYLPPDIPLADNKIEIIPLEENNAEIIVANSKYKQYIDPEYIKERINKSFSAGVIVEGKLVAWALTHDDGAIGVLHVLDDFRKKGYAAEIVIHLAEKIRNAKSIPVAQIEEKNTPAIKLFTKIGFIKDRKVTWLRLKD